MRVGTSTSLHSFIRAIKDHPHACGDKKQNDSPKGRKRGSSPCVWGQVRRISPLLPILRIIPMRVGTRGYSVSACVVVWDHPHACGDKTSAVTPSVKILGSSPCVWGQVKNCANCRYGHRIIPMRVGTSVISRKKLIPIVDHPHACGDKVRLLAVL